MDLIKSIIMMLLTCALFMHELENVWVNLTSSFIHTEVKLIARMRKYYYALKCSLKF